MFELKLDNSELEALDAILMDCVKSEDNILPSWTYRGQNVWDMDFNEKEPEIVSVRAIETAVVA